MPGFAFINQGVWPSDIGLTPNQQFQRQEDRRLWTAQADRLSPNEQLMALEDQRCLEILDAIHEREACLVSFAYRLDNPIV